MKPGPKLDALIAEKVMDDEYRLDSNGPIWVYNRSFHEFAKLYSTSIEYAWEVLNHIVSTSHAKPLVWYDQSTEMWVCEFSGGICEYSESAPHAICMAALKAKGIKIG